MSFLYNHAWTWQTGKAYFADVNADGLPDFVDQGTVYFDHLDANGNPYYEANNADTAVPIDTGSIDASIRADLSATLAQMRAQAPLQDVLRRWVAPYDGQVKIERKALRVKSPEPPMPFIRSLPRTCVLLMLPKMSGLEVCRILKGDAATSHIPVLMLTAKAEEIDRIVGLEFGADDYVTKPFSPREVTLRIRAILRRGEKPEETLQAGSISIDPGRHQVRVNGKRVHLTSLEFKLLRTLMQRRGRVQERDKLLNDVWGYESVIDTRTVDTHVRRLREKLGKAGDAIETVRGFGYRLREE